MKKDLKRIEKQIEETLQSLNHLEKAKANPFFYTRLEAKISEKSEILPKTNFALKPVWSIVMILLLIGLNLFTYITVWKERKNQNQQSIDNVFSGSQSGNQNLYELNLQNE